MSKVDFEIFFGPEIDKVRLLDFYAGMALNAILSNPSTMKDMNMAANVSGVSNPKYISKICHDFGLEMLDQRSKYITSLLKQKEEDAVKCNTEKTERINCD